MNPVSKPVARKAAPRKSAQSVAAPEVAVKPMPLGTTRYRGYLIRCNGESFSVSLAGDELVRQPYPGSRQRMGSGALDVWMLEQAKAYVDAKRAGHV